VKVVKLRRKKSSKICSKKSAPTSLPEEDSIHISKVTSLRNNSHCKPSDTRCGRGDFDTKLSQKKNVNFLMLEEKIRGRTGNSGLGYGSYRCRPV